MWNNGKIFALHRSEQKMKDVEGIESEQVMVLERLKQNQRQDYLKVGP